MTSKTAVQQQRGAHIARTPPNKPAKESAPPSKTATAVAAPAVSKPTSTVAGEEKLQGLLLQLRTEKKFTKASAQATANINHDWHKSSTFTVAGLSSVPGLNKIEQNNWERLKSADINLQTENGVADHRELMSILAKSVANTQVTLGGELFYGKQAGAYLQQRVLTAHGEAKKHLEGIDKHLAQLAGKPELSEAEQQEHDALTAERKQVQASVTRLTHYAGEIGVNLPGQVSNEAN